MPNWDGIEDVSSEPLRVWFSRIKDTDDWLPLRKVDCFALNDSAEGVTSVIVEGGRSTADKEKLIITSNFHRAPDRMLASAIWFVRKEANSKDKVTNLVPIFDWTDSQRIENLYQVAVGATSSFGPGIDKVLKEEVELSDKSKVSVVQSHGGTVLSMKKKPEGWLVSREDLQRGYGLYTVEGEDNERMLGPLKHLIFVVHGIGEAIWSREDTSMSSLREECNRMRITVQTRQIEEWRKQCEKAKKEGKPIPTMPDRIEIIPIEWYDRIHSSSSSLSKSLKATTLPTIPALRGIANEAVFDVLMYMTPGYCLPVLECVTAQINSYYEKFLEVHPRFLLDGGKCNLVGHSLGSVICWDLLSILKDFGFGDDNYTTTNNSTTSVPRQPLGGEGSTRQSSGGVNFTNNGETGVGLGFETYGTKKAEEEKDVQPQNGTWGPTLPDNLKETLPFIPENVVFLGSPLGMFLTLRGAHPVFNDMRKELDEQVRRKVAAKENNETNPQIMDQGEESAPPPASSTDEEEELKLPYASPFSFPINGGLYNIFHPSDPVAYRIEPLLLPPEMEAEEFPNPVHVTVQGQGVRFHVKAQQIGDEIGKVLDGRRGTFATFIQQSLSALGKHGEVEIRAIEAEKSNNIPMGPQVFPLGGKSSRVDYQLQRGVVDNEYISAVMAHSSYFVNTDVLDFFIDLAGPFPPGGEEPPKEEDSGGRMIQPMDL
ncbi:SEC23-interacting protein [Seminavis robusta]|uniref:SEC23-interacting protein n=1 Tax=Seminavis robusta TaxID=568900 RepID=A0A9N8HMS7_9STRA|nr:SEC23-interacting protein [Seminavis robusta]|eukprot:Sro768_g199690.1 SEC23-interacting protein (711) ;mRNA; r:40980-43112